MTLVGPYLYFAVARRGDVVVEPAEHRRRRRRRDRATGQLAREQPRDEQAHRARLDVALDAGEQAREPDARPRRAARSAGPSRDGASMYVLRWIEPKRRNSARRSAGIIWKIRCCSGYASRVWNPTRLYAVQVAVLGAQLDDRPRPVTGARVAQADRPHRPEPQRLRAALGHHLDRHAALEVARLLEVVRQDLAARVAPRRRTPRTRPCSAGSSRSRRRRCRRPPRARPRHGGLVPAPARRAEREVPVDRVGRDDRRDRVVEVHAIAAELARGSPRRARLR